MIEASAILSVIKGVAAQVKPAAEAAAASAGEKAGEVAAKAGEVATKAGEAAQAGGPSLADLKDGTFWLPPQSSSVAPAVDWLFYGILGLSIFCFVGITVATVWFCIKYRASKVEKPTASESHNDSLEITWTVIPCIIVVFIFFFGWKGYMDLKATPMHGHEIRVDAWQWNWNFKYENGYTDNVLHVPVDEPVRLVMKSQDVLHSFFVPAFRVKQDIIPGRYTDIWFEATEPGTYRLYCAEYCGTDHSEMTTYVVVHEPGGFEQYMDKGLQKMMDLPPVELGALLYEKKGCVTCHSIDGSSGKGPSWKGIWGETHTMKDGSKLVVDENYVRESILTPSKHVRVGFTDQMSTFQGKITDRGIDGIIAYIKSLK